VDFNIKSLFLAPVAALALVASGCFTDNPSADRPGDGSELKIRISTQVPPVNTLAKGQAITLAKLIHVFTSNGTPADTVRDTITTSTTPSISSSSTGDQTVNKNYTLKGLRLWKLVATVIDTRGYVVHRDSVTMGSHLPIAGTASVSLNLVPRYAMYEAKFLTIPDSVSSLSTGIKSKLTVTRLVLKIDGSPVRDSSASPFTALGTHVLDYDYVSVSHGATRASGTSKKLNAITFPNGSDTGYAVGDTIALRTVDGGLSWSALGASASPRSLRAVSFATGAKGIVGGDSVSRGYTTNGTTWPVHTKFVGTSAHSTNAVFLVNDTGYAATAPLATPGTASLFYYTTNGGTSWTSMGTQTKSTYAMHCLTTQLCWIVGGEGMIRKKTSFSNQFTTAQTKPYPGITRHLRGVRFINANTGWAVGDSGAIIKTTNGGTNWTSQSSGTTQHLKGVHFVDTNLGFAVGNAGTVLATVNGGTTWAPQISGTTANLNGLSFSGSEGYAVGDSGRIVRLSEIHLVEMQVYGTLPGWGSPGLLFSGSRYVNSQPGKTDTVSINLTWVGSTTGTAALTATIGKIGKVTLEGGFNPNLPKSRKR
jgi:photosystem II stability/assembly factor-like uncharacterized protein